MLDKSANAGQHTYAERGNDCYETPPEAVHALLKVEKLPEGGIIWEPACGPGSIAKALQELGHIVVATDLYDYGYGQAGLDFLSPGVLGNYSAVVTNPPYQLAQKFVEKALGQAPLVIMLLRLAFMESIRRAHILDRGSGLTRIHVFSRRLPMMHRHNFQGKKASSAIAFAWFVYERGYMGPITIDRIDWK